MDCLTDFVDNPNSLYISILVVALSLLYYFVKNRGLPPGPTGIPYLGYWPFLSSDRCHVDLLEMTKKYGEISSFTVSGRTYINLGSYKVAREAHITKSDCFGERVQGYSIVYYYLRDGVPFAEYEQWKTLRKFYLQQFRERGMNVMKESLSAAMYDPVKEAVKELKEVNGQQVNIAEFIIVKSSKIMRLALLGEDGISEEGMIEYVTLYADTLASQAGRNLLLIGEIARYFMLPFCQDLKKGQKSHLKIMDILYEMINKRKATYNENHIRDFVDAYIKERDDRKAKNDPTYKFFTDKCLMGSLIQIIGDGIVFMGMFVASFIQALLDHPEEQDKLYRELVDVCGLDRNPEMDDKSKLTYTNAFILEVMRTTDVLPFFPSTQCTKETTINGYRIPKGAIAVYNFYAAHRNPNDYKEPEKFNPSRFIVGKSQKPDMLPLFGLGRRSCMGEGFAMNQAFLFLTMFVKNFRLSQPPGSEDPRLLIKSGIMNVIAEPRVHN